MFGPPSPSCFDEHRSQIVCPCFYTVGTSCLTLVEIRGFYLGIPPESECSIQWCWSGVPLKFEQCSENIIVLASKIPQPYVSLVFSGYLSERYRQPSLTIAMYWLEFLRIIKYQADTTDISSLILFICSTVLLVSSSKIGFRMREWKRTGVLAPRVIFLHCNPLVQAIRSQVQILPPPANFLTWQPHVDRGSPL